MTLRRLDALWLFVLVTARIRIDTLADLVAPRDVETIRRIGWLSALLPDAAWELLSDWLTDPLSLLLIALTFLLVVAYLLVDLWQPQNAPRWKMAIVCAVIGTTVVAQSLYLIALRHEVGPAAFTHDGGVIQTEETIKFLLQGKNPYVEDYTQTPMAEWGLDLRTALYHFPYLPWTFLFSTPFYLLANATLGWYDQRWVYLLLFAGTLWLSSRLTRDATARLLLVMTLGLNPIMGSDIIFGQNDSFVLFWLVAAFFAASRRHRWAMPASLILLALACASKPTAWFLAPFIFTYWLGRSSVAPDHPLAAVASLFTPHLLAFWAWRRDPASLRALAQHVARFTPFALTFLLVVLPFYLWDPYHFVDDVWAWSAGTSPTAYQIRGWGMSNFVLAFAWVPSRLAYFPFWVPELLICVPLLALTLWQQWRENTLANAVWHGALLLFAFAFTSRFLNENYLGFIAALLSLGALAAPDPDA